MDGVSTLYGEELDFTAENTVQLSWSGFSDTCAPIETYEVSLQVPNNTASWEARVRRRKSEAENAAGFGYNGGLHSRQDLTSSGTVVPIGTDPGEEDKLILDLVKAHGRKWAFISRQLPGRTDNAVKKRFDGHIHRRLG